MAKKLICRQKPIPALEYIRRNHLGRLLTAVRDHYYPKGWRLVSVVREPHGFAAVLQKD